MKIVTPSATLLTYTPHPLELIERCGRVCYKSEERVTENPSLEFIRKIIGNGHEAALEHASATFLIVCDRGVTHELVRHRIGIAYCQESTRYCNYGADKFGRETSIIEPPGLDQCSDPRFHNCIREDLMCCPWHIWAASVQRAEDAYLLLIDKGVSPQIARSVLPTCLKTEIAVTANFREWRHIIRLRTSPKAQPQMQEIAKQILTILSNKCLCASWI